MNLYIYKCIKICTCMHLSNEYLVNTESLYDTSFTDTIVFNILEIHLNVYIQKTSYFFLVTLLRELPCFFPLDLDFDISLETSLTSCFFSFSSFSPSLSDFCSLSSNFICVPAAAPRVLKFFELIAGSCAVLLLLVDSALRITPAARSTLCLSRSTPAFPPVFLQPQTLSPRHILLNPNDLV